jgi:spore maturation protein CgeB
MLLEPARQSPKEHFVVAGSMYPQDIEWPANVQMIDHLEPSLHRGFYSAQRFTLNVTRAPMLVAGYSPSVRLFEAAACSTGIISDRWPGLEDFFEIGTEILVAETTDDVLKYLGRVTDEGLERMVERARLRTLKHHSSVPRAQELVETYQEVAELKSAARA